jgi:hypothetical protein
MQSQGPYHNIQQLSDAVMRLESASGDEQTNFTSFLVSQVQPLVTRIATLEKTIADLQAAIAELKGTPKTA